MVDLNPRYETPLFSDEWENNYGKLVGFLKGEAENVLISIMRMANRPLEAREDVFMLVRINGETWELKRAEVIDGHGITFEARKRGSTSLLDYQEFRIVPSLVEEDY